MLKHDASVEKPVEHGGGHHGVVGRSCPRRRRPGSWSATVELFRYLVVIDLESEAAGFVGQGQVAHLVDDQEARSGEETAWVVAHRTFERGPVTAGHQIGGRRV